MAGVCVQPEVHGEHQDTQGYRVNLVSEYQNQRQQLQKSSNVHKLCNYYLSRTNAHVKFISKYLKCAFILCITFFTIIDNEFIYTNCFSYDSIQDILW